MSATGGLRNALAAFRSVIASLSDHSSANDISGTCYIFILPPEILQTITEYLEVPDIISLSRTCHAFHSLIDNDNFWIHRIRCQFSPPIAQLYTFDIFEKPEYIQTYDEPRSSGFEHIRNEYEIDQLANNSATHYNDEAIERRHAKMYVSKEDFLRKVQYYRYKKPRNRLSVPLMKCIYFYLIDRKREATVDMSVIHRNANYLVEQPDSDSLKGRIIHLRSVCWLEINGRFQNEIMPGKYEVIWRMKCQANYFRMWADTEFIVVPSHGKLLVHRVSENDFRTYALQNVGQWFLINMGHIIIYEPSKVLLAIRNYINGFWKSGISWDCIELKIVP